jgi:uncharacterized membrane protein
VFVAIVAHSDLFDNGKLVVALAIGLMMTIYFRFGEEDFVFGVSVSISALRLIS